MPEFNVGGFQYLVTVHAEMHANFGAKMSIQLATTKIKTVEENINNALYCMRYIAQ